MYTYVCIPEYTFNEVSKLPNAPKSQVQPEPCTWPQCQRKNYKSGERIIKNNGNFYDLCPYRLHRTPG